MANLIIETVRQLIEHHNGVRAAARATNIDAATLVRLRDGLISNPSQKTLKKLGVTLTLERRTS
jgi:hypothetical protein